MHKKIILLTGLVSGLANAKTFDCKLIQYGGNGTLVQHTQMQVNPDPKNMKSEKFDVNGIRFELRSFESKFFVRISPITKPASYVYVSAKPEDKNIETTFALDILDVGPVIGAVHCTAN